MIQSGGVLVKSPTVLWSGTPSTWGNWSSSLELSSRWSSYSSIYRQQLWVAVLVNKRSRAMSRLPFKVYERGEQGRREVADHPYARLHANPNPRQSGAALRRWTRSTQDIFGEAIWLKRRDRGGRPVEVYPIHPTRVRVDEDKTPLVYEIRVGGVDVRAVESDIVHFREYNPDSLVRGLSPLEPLRRTLENEDASRRATSAFWRNGARPSVVLSHPGKLSPTAATRVKAEWESVHGGADNFAQTAVLEEGMKPEVLSLSAEEAQYIEGRKLNREEACAIYDTPPPVVHILDHATFSNITEQMRSMYRDTMAPVLNEYEDTCESQLRASVRPGATDPDFGADVYGEFLLDEVLRGAFETRTESYQKAINSGWLTPAEVREMENRPFIAGSDRLFVNSTMVPLELAGETAATEPALPPETVRTVMGRLSRVKTLAELDSGVTAGLNGESATVLAELDAAKTAGESVEQFKDRLRALVKG